ncbi:MAG: chemotaxis protein CheB [Balneolales bacterium]
MHPGKSKKNLVIVAIGSSAGGLNALSGLVSHLPENLDNVAFVIAQHLSPTYKSHLIDLLSKKTSINIEAVSDGTQIKPATIYVTPRDRELTFEKNQFSLVQEQAAGSSGPKPSINNLFRSLASDKDKNLIGIVLSGSGNDGTEGIRAIKQAGGYTIAQEPATAEYSGMPLAAIDSGFVDYVLNPEDMGSHIQEMTGELLDLDEDLFRDVNKTDALDEIFKLLSRRTQTNFENYKPSTIYRRLYKRLNKLKIYSFNDYLKHIREKPSEIDVLFDTLLIGVTAFFRDKESFDELAKYLEKLIEKKSKGDSIRIWVPGCATGEEPYSIAIILHRILKQDFRDYNIQIFATDIDDKALNTGRKGVYSKEALRELDPATVNKYFSITGKGYAVSKPVRALVLFSKHDLTVHPPFLRLDLISCRNLFIYFSTGLQKQLLPFFHYALNRDAYLFLGKAETVGMFTDLFSVVSPSHKLYKRKRGGNNKSALRFGNFKAQRFGDSQPPSKDTSITGLVKETLYTVYPHPYVVINDNHNILKIKGDVHHFLGLQEGDMDTNLFRMAHDSLQIDLRTAVSKASEGKSKVSSKFKRINLDGQAWNVLITVQPLANEGRLDNELYLVSFEKQKPDKKEKTKTAVSDQESQQVLELEQELQSTKENMQRYIEDLETANEELQSLNEEMQSTSEELHTSNEELESTNEELQSSYDEIQRNYEEMRSVNQALEKKENELRKSESNTRALLNNTLQSFVLIDRQYKIITYNDTAFRSYKDMLNKEMTPGTSFIDFITAENTETFRNDLNKVFSGETVSGIMTIKGKMRLNWFRYNYTPVVNKKGEIEVVSCSNLDITAEKTAQHDLARSEQLKELFFESPGVGVILTDEEGFIFRVNDAYCHMSGYSREELLGKPFTITVVPEDRKRAMGNYRKFKDGLEVEEESGLYRKDKKTLDVMITGILVTDLENRHFKLSTFRDITKIRQFEEKLQESVREKEYMLQEIHHRVKNNMAVITGLLSLQGDTIKDDKLTRLFRESENRIRSIAMIHEKLYQNENLASIKMDGYIKELDRMIFDLIQPDVHIKTNIRARDVSLNIASAVPCGLIIHELLINAYEHAFKGRKEGCITVLFTHAGDKYQLVIEDDGVGMPETVNPNKSKTLGLNLVQGLSRQLNADVTIRRKNGTKVLLEFRSGDGKN